VIHSEEVPRINDYKSPSNLTMKTELDKLMYLATLNLRLPDQFAPFPSVYGLSCHVGCNIRERGVSCRSVSPETNFNNFCKTIISIATDVYIRQISLSSTNYYAIYNY
jgi:hypothetical protein